MAQIGLIDYGMGNIHSVKKSIENIGEKVLLINNKKKINKCKAIIIPGQGSFDPAIEKLEGTGLIHEIKEWIAKGNPFLGICLGLQLLFDSSDEGSKKGLGLINGRIKKIPFTTGQRIPHIGWCNLIPANESKLLKNYETNNWVYFDHSYYASPLNKKIISANAQYGSINLTAMIEHENLVACQFHPEKSGKKGDEILKRWLKNLS